MSSQWLPQQWERVRVFLEENRQHIFYLLAFYLVTIALFIERFMRELDPSPVITEIFQDD